MTAACDTPFFPADLVARLQTAAQCGASRYRPRGIWWASDFVFALWPVALADDLAAYLADGRRKVQDWIERHAHVAVEFEPRQIGGVEVDPFFNINTPDDLAMAESWLAKEPQ